METKFDIGDKVKILDGNTADDYFGSWAHRMDMLIGKIVTIDGIEIRDCRIGYYMKEVNLVFDERYLEKVSEEKCEKYYSGKIRFQTGDEKFITGKTYEVVNGQIYAPRIDEMVPDIFDRDGFFKDFEDVKDFFCCDMDRKRYMGWAPYTLELTEVKDE